VHRDIKPGNIMITASGAKLLDFGLAKPSNNSGDDTRSLITQANERLGTPAYMAPEQLTGAADHRSDIYALGAVVFEMLTGARAFTSGATPAALRPDTLPGLDRLIRKCLEKDPDRRWQSAADLADELRWIQLAPPAAARARSSGWMVAAAAMLAVLAIGGVAIPRFAAPEVVPTTQLSFLLPPDVMLPAYSPGVAISPDGSLVAFSGVASSGGPLRLFVKRLDVLEATVIADSDNAIYPVFSPDGQSLAFFNPGHAMKWSVATGTITKIADLSGQFDGGSAASWSSDGMLLFGMVNDQPQHGIRQVAATGGTPEDLTRPDNAQREQTHFAPTRLPGRQLMFTVRSVGSKGVEFKVVTRDQSGTVTTLIPGAFIAAYLGGNQILYQTGNTLMLADFEPSSLRLSNSKTVIDGVFVTTNGASWAVAGDTIVYRPVEPPRRRLVWVDRSGRITPIDIELRDFANPSISPSGDRVALAVQRAAASDVWILDLSRRTLAPLTTDGVSGAPVWSADGQQVAMSHLNGAGRDVVVHPTDGSSPARVLLATGGQNFVAALDGHSTLMSVMTPADNDGRDISVMDRNDPATLRAIVKTPAIEYGGRLSPNGKWLSYFSDASGRMQLYVTPFPDGGAKWQVSRNGAREAVWSRDGRELYFRQGDGMYGVAVHDSAAFEWDQPRELFKGAFFQQGGPGNVHYDVAADGRFLMIEEASARSPSFNVVRNWRALAK